MVVCRYYRHLYETADPNEARDLPDMLGCCDVEFPSCRLVLTLLAFFGFLNIYCLRVNLSVALVAMVNHTAPVKQNVTGNERDQCGNLIAEQQKGAQVGLQFTR